MFDRSYHSELELVVAGYDLKNYFSKSVEDLEPYPWTDPVYSAIEFDEATDSIIPGLGSTICSYQDYVWGDFLLVALTS